MKTTRLFPGLLIIFFSACTSDSRSSKQLEAGGLPPETSSPSGATIVPTSRTSSTNMKGYHANIERDTRANNNFRKVLYTSQHMQLVLMSLKPGEEIGSEAHVANDQFFRFEGGTGKCVINGNTYVVSDGDVIIAPAGSEHNVINTSPTKALKLYTIYAPPQHKDGIVRATKQEATKAETKFDGKTSE